MSHALQIFDADGNETLGPTTTMLRHVSSHFIPANWSGQITVPDFDDTKGFIVPSLRLGKRDYNTQLPDNEPWRSSGSPVASGAVPAEIPNLFWDQSEHTLNVTDRQVPSGWVNQPIDTDVRIRFYTYAGGSGGISSDYGVDIFNEKGERQLSFEKTMYLRDSGVTQGVTHGANENIVFDQVTGSLADVPRLRYNNPYYDEYYQKVPSGHHSEVQPNGFEVVYPYVTGVDDLIFYKLNVAITCSCSVYQEYPELLHNGMTGIVAAENNPPIEYKIASTTPAPTVFQETHALQIFDENGDVTFDSRYPTIQVVDVFFLSEADVTSILDGTPVYFTVSEPITEMWVCSPWHVSYRLAYQSSGTPGAGWSRPKIEQIDSTTIKVSRTRHANISTATTWRELIQSMQIIIAK